MSKNLSAHNGSTSNAGAHVRNSPMLRNMSSPLRRIWVKRANGTPTTIMVLETDIFDDVKLAVCLKFPHSLGRYYDPADLQIQIRAELLDKASRRVVSKKTPIYRLMEVSEESLKSPASNNYNISLEPDQNVWEFLDENFPNAMAISDAFIVEVNTENKGRFESSAPTPLEDRTYQKNEEYHYNPPLLDRLTSPPQQWANQGRLSPLTSLTDRYHQPKPQRPITLKQNMFGKNPSVSPILPQRLSPLYKFNHQRSRSNPLQSRDSFNLTSKTNNSQAVLLMPKNFFFGEQNQTSMKRYSLDENLVSKRGNNDSPSDNETDRMTNVSGIESPLKQSISFGSEEKLSNSPITEEISTKGSPGRPNKTTSQTSVESDALSSRQNTKEPHSQTRIALPKSTGKTHSGNTITKTINSSTFEKVLPLISVLVVEDNSINQAILGAFLRKHKIHYEIAKNGQEAVDKWRKGGFHLVLMDIQLPVKSGIEATKEIRHLERINRIGVFAEHELSGAGNGSPLAQENEILDLNIFRSPVIIVALTASSNSSADKNNALTAGCNDFLTKPVNLVWLQNKITEWGCMQSLINFDGWRTKGTTVSNNIDKKKMIPKLIPGRQERVLKAN